MKAVSMKRAIAIAALGASVCSAPAHAINYQVAGTITNVRNYTLRHPNGFANGFTLLQLSAPMEGGCSWGFIDATDKNALAFVLATKASGATVMLTYESHTPSPWGDTIVCAVIAIDVP